MKAFASYPLVRFIATGGFSALVNVGVRLLLSQWLIYEVAVALAYLCGMTVAFLLARAFVFQSTQGDATGEYIRFGLVNLMSFAQVWLVSVGLARLLFPALGFVWHAETVAHIIGVCSPVLTSYFAHKHFTFAGASKTGITKA
jgi:putative flippase GtrA